VIQYLLDEHIPSVYRAALLLREPALPVAQIGEGNAPAKGTLDPNVLVWCEAHRYLLFNVEELILIAGASLPDEYQNLLLYLPITHDVA
jgi:hypothetical protein